MWRDTMRGWRAFALVFYLVVTALEFFEVVGDALGFGDLSSYAAFGGITPEQEAQRLGSLILLSGGILIAAAFSAFGVYGNKSWTVRAGTITGILLILYGMYQILSGLSVLQANQFSVILAGSVYGFAGLFSMWLVRQAATR